MDRRTGVGWLNDCANAAAHFRAVAISRAESELVAAGGLLGGIGRRWRAAALNWSKGLMKQAARSPESFYGLVARQTLGMDRKVAPGAGAGEY